MLFYNIFYNQNHWGSMAQTQMRMPRHSFRPDGNKPYGPHGPMAPPPHMKVN